MTRTPRLLAMSASGRYVALRRPGAIELVDIQGTAPRRTFPPAGDFAIAGASLCLVDETGTLRVESLDGARTARTLALPDAHARATAFHGRTADAIVAGDALVALAPSPCIVHRADAGARWFPLHGRAVLEVAESRLAIVTPGRAVPIDLAIRATVRDAVPLFGGRSLAIIATGEDGDAGDSALVITPAGHIIHRVALPASRWHAFAVDRGQLLLGPGDSDVLSVDLRYGRIAAHGTAPHAVSELAIDAEGRSIAIAGPSGGDIPLVSVLRTDDLLRAQPQVAAPALDDTRAASDDARTASGDPRAASGDARVVSGGARVASDDDRASSGGARAVSGDAHGLSEEAPRLSGDTSGAVLDVTVPDLLPLALGEPKRAVREAAACDAAPFASPSEHVAALLDLVGERAAVAIAEAWHSGRISADAPEHLPFEREVLALAGAPAALAADRVAAAHARLANRAEELADRVRATLAAGIELPFVAFARELALSAIATQLLIAVVGPRVRPELARLYRILANETGRPVCDAAILAQLLGGNDAALRDAIADELASHAPLVRSGAIVCRARGGFDVDDTVLAQLRGQPARSSAATTIRCADRGLDELVLDRGVLRRLVGELADPRPAAPVRVALRGRRGSGRHTIIAALAARVDRTVAEIDATQLPQATFADALQRELAHAYLSRAVPVVSGLDARDDREVDHLVRQVLRMHPGPVVLRTSPDADVPLDPGHVDIRIPALSETDRRAALAGALAAVGIANADVALLAQRYRIGPGTMVRVAAEARRRIDRGTPDATQIVDDVARQHVASRIGKAAQRITKLADWDQVALPDDMLDSLRELVGRARHSRTVFEEWGYDRRITTSRGLTALFYGPPGTGKTMVAGLIARELGLEVYRVDLAKVVSKWVGETEKNLGEIFDAAEDGQIMLLFDEADSLFARRSDVKSANDRYANLEVNYLLQRLDSFEGIAILTTNLEGSIDPAFKRRLSMRLYFPFPDEEMRARLWASHITTTVPTAGSLDYGALARRFPLSGGYIRNSALRAAFLAAQERTPLTQAHLERAVLLEYRELGKLAEDGRME